MYDLKRYLVESFHGLFSQIIVASNCSLRESVWHGVTRKAPELSARRTGMSSLDVPRVTYVVAFLLFATGIGHVLVSGEAKSHIKNLIPYYAFHGYGVSPVLLPVKSCDFQSTELIGTWQPADDQHFVIDLRDSSELSKSRRCPRSKERAVLGYTFSPHGCTVPPLRLLRREGYYVNHLPILWAGDSLLGQLYSSFTSLAHLNSSMSHYAKSYLLVDPYSLKVVRKIDLDRCRKAKKACPRGTNEYVIHHKPNATPPHHRSIENLGTWASLIETGTFKTIVLNTGHHFWKEKQPSEGFPEGGNPFKKYGTMVKNIAVFLQASNFSGQVIYVTSPPGFPNCDDKWMPGTLARAGVDPYSWSMPAQNEHHWSEMFETYAPNISFTVLNITFMSITRGDAHPSKDCLHFCQIGLPDEWTRMLMALLAARPGKAVVE
mmetsp:Transcript_1627/g.6491  ORF Transcript_1627/g.6491 Transcript_1627/m.6491 type:complete len:433 (+) Transcript_1627:76-1374(+)